MKKLDPILFLDLGAESLKIVKAGTDLQKTLEKLRKEHEYTIFFKAKTQNGGTVQDWDLYMFRYEVDALINHHGELSKRLCLESLYSIEDGGKAHTYNKDKLYEAYSFLERKRNKYIITPVSKKVKGKDQAIALKKQLDEITDRSCLLIKDIENALPWITHYQET